MAVAAIAALRFARASPAAWSAFVPFAILGVPLSGLGGALDLPAPLFRPVTGALLVAAGGYMAWSALVRREQATADRGIPAAEALAVGAVVGVLSGAVGFGGGILVAPWLLARRRTSALTAAGVAALFNLFNSAAAALGAWSLAVRQPPAFAGWALAAICGGWLGATFGSRHLPAVALRLGLASLLEVAGARLLLA